jgi:hypothetical protein
MPRGVRLGLILLGGWIAIDELHGLGVGGLPIGPVKWLHLVVMGAGAILILLRAAVRREERTAWLLLGLGVGAWVLGELYFTAVLWSDASPPVPSPADAGYLSLPPLVFAGLAVLARTRIRGLPICFWASDTVYLVKAAEGTWQSGGPYDPGWWTISICFAAAAWSRPLGRAAAPRDRALISVPIVFALVSLAVLIAGTLTDPLTGLGKTASATPRAMPCCSGWRPRSAPC